ncbi:hypothetical protein F7725_009307 [Dissostichus mawsoni]|uniref:DH domain-containing protein n=1 Tax=Dissostichus mawsoni TaxID=36200 RepID=A0A7J5ZAR9_DISMA|nr:hypothetical protein F7725_009307 [Dissostichus mawsoni]
MGSSPHSVKRWQLSGTDYEQVRSTRLSCWTPLNNQSNNLQLFEERMTLVLHWFDLWTDRQRKHLLHSLLTLDFTAVLPRFLSLYVMSFLSPRDLCSAAQVSWHWRMLSEQKEYGAWKNHYVSCVSTLDWLTPREAAEQYGTLNQQSTLMTEEEEEEERRKERRIRQMIRDKLQEDKRQSMSTRRAWGSYTKPGAARGGSTQTGRPSSGITSSSWPSLSWPRGLLCLSLDRGQTMSAALSRERVHICSPSSERLNNASGALSSFTSRPSLTHTVPPTHLTHPVLLLLISNRIPAYELLLSGVKAGVIVVLYDHRGTLSALLAQVERAIIGQGAQRLGLLAPGGTEEIHLLHRCILSERTLLNPDQRDFWEKLSGWVAPAEEGGGIDIFSPLAACAPGAALIQTLSSLTGLEVRTPMGLATGSFQNTPALQFVCERVLQGWCRQAEWMEEALEGLRGHLGPQLQRLSLEARGRALGGFQINVFFCGTKCASRSCVSRDLNEALIEGLNALTRQRETRPLEFLAGFLTRWTNDKDGEESTLDWRGAAARELHHSECLYLGRLGAVLKVYQEPLTAALNSNRAILSYNDIHMVLSPVTQILELNRVFQVDLEARLQQWGAEQCVGDVLMKLCSKLRVYTNYLNNYTTAIHTIDKDAALLRSPDEQIPDSLRIYEHVSDVGLFLFNDALVLTRRRVHHTPFTLTYQSTHTFLASVALSSLSVREITHTRWSLSFLGVCHRERRGERALSVCAASRLKRCSDGTSVTAPDNTPAGQEEVWTPLDTTV